MVANDLSALSVFLTVAEERSFTRAAKRLGVSPSAVSHSMRELEEEIGVRLLSRTTRSVAPTALGEHLLVRLRPAFTDIREALGQVSGFRNKPAGRVRLLVPRLAASTVLAPKLGEFARDYPDIVLEVTTDDSRMDIVAEGFDAGIHFGEYIEKDMIAVRVSRTSDRRSWARPIMSKRMEGRSRRVTYCGIDASTSGTGMPAYIAGSLRKVRKPY